MVGMNGCKTELLELNKLNGELIFMARKCTTRGKDFIVMERRIRVIELRKVGMSIRAIARQLNAEGYECSHITVHKDLWRSLNELNKFTPPDEAERMRCLELERLDDLWLAHWGVAVRGNIAAVLILVAISKLRCKLLGIGNVEPLKVKINTEEALAKLLGKEPENLPEEKSAKGKRANLET